MLRRTLFLCGAVAASSLVACAQLHHVQLGDIDARRGRLRPFDVKVSETGISLDEARAVTNVLASKADKGNLDQIMAIVQLFQMGPHTGNGVFGDKYAEGLIDTLYEKCPSGRITGIQAVRESRKYPVISGEIVRITGYCIEGGKKGGKPVKNFCLVLAATLLLGGCATLQSVSLTQIPADRSHKIRAESSKFVFFFLTFDNDYADEARDELKAKCKNGKVTGILTKDEYINYFLGIVAKRRIVAEAFCDK